MCLRGMNYIFLVDRLASRQFPAEKDLPDSDGYFSRPKPFSDENPLTISHCEITTRQLKILRGEDVGDIASHEAEAEAEAIHSHTMTETLTQTEVDNCFDLDMEFRSENASNAASQTITSQQLHLQPADAVGNTAGMSQSQHTDAIPTLPPQLAVAAGGTSKAGRGETLTASGNDEQCALFTQNMTQESDDIIEKWLSTSAPTSSPVSASLVVRGGPQRSQLSAVPEEDSQGSRRSRRRKENAKANSSESSSNGTGYSVSSDSAEDASEGYGRRKLRSGRVFYSEKASVLTHGKQPEERAQQEEAQNQEILTQPQAPYIDSDAEEKEEKEETKTKRKSDESLSAPSPATSKRHRARSPLSTTRRDRQERDNAGLTLPTQAETSSLSSLSQDVTALSRRRVHVNAIIGQKVKKKFTGYGWFTGKVTSFSK
jgi:hypothetical protein